VFLGQGKITELVEAKPDKRRKIFDAILETDHLVKMQELVRGDLRELQTKVKALLERKEILEQGPSAKDLEKELQDVEENMKQVIERVQVFEQAAKELEEVQRIKADMENTEADIAALRSEIEKLKEAAERDTRIRLIKELRSKYAELEQWQIQLEELTKNKDKLEKDILNRHWKRLWGHKNHECGSEDGKTQSKIKRNGERYRCFFRRSGLNISFKSGPRCFGQQGIGRYGKVGCFSGKGA